MFKVRDLQNFFAGKKTQVADQPITAPQAAAVSWTTLVGQAAALLTVATALILGTGQLVLFARSWYERFPWNTLLQEFSTGDLQLIGAGAILPSFAIALVWTYAGEKLRHAWKSEVPGPDGRPLDSKLFQWAIRVLPLIAVILLALVTPLSIAINRAAAGPNLYKSAWVCFLVPLGFGLAFYMMGLVFIRPILELPSAGFRRAFFIVTTTLVVTPSVASFIGTFPFPAAQVCTKDHGAVLGRLVGTSDKYIYIAADGLARGSVESRQYYVVTVPADQVVQTFVGIGNVDCPALTTTGK